MNKFRGQCEVTIGGEKRPMVFNMHTFAIVCEGLKISISDFEKAFADERQTRAFMWLVFAGLSTYLEMKGKSVDFTYFDVSDWILDLSDGDVTVIMETLSRSKETNLPEGEKVEVKKK
jgi:hypothetical protein